MVLKRVSSSRQAIPSRCAGGLFILEHPKRLDAPDLGGVGAPKDRRVTAASALSFYDAPDAGHEPP